MNIYIYKYVEKDIVVLIDGFLFCRSKQRMRERFMNFTGVGSIPSTTKHGKQRARIDPSSKPL